MVPAPIRTVDEDGLYGGLGPHPSHVQVAKPFIFEQSIQQCLDTNYGPNEAREASIRLQGVQWIENVRKALKLPVRSFMTAVVYYHRFRLAHAEADYMNVDAAAAALFTACKIEDTLKKSRDILCAAYNLKVSLGEQLTPDDSIFEDPAKRLVGLERLMLESSGFDFRNRDPQDWIIKFTRLGQFERDTVGKTAYRICLDLYRTYAPLKQTATTLGLACVELAARLHNASIERLTELVGDTKTAFEKWGTSRAEVMETLLDVLELYTHNRNATSVAPLHSMDVFIAIRIALNKESSADDLPRFTEWVDLKQVAANGHDQDVSNGSVTRDTPITTNGTANPLPASPANVTAPSTVQRSPASAGQQSDNIVSASPATGASNGKTRQQQQQDAKREGTVRYMLDASRARDEKDTVESYFKEEWEEYEEIIERPAKVAPAPAATPTGPATTNSERSTPGGTTQASVAAALLDADESTDKSRAGASKSSSVNGDHKSKNGNARGISKDRKAGSSSNGGGAASSRTAANGEKSKRSGPSSSQHSQHGSGSISSAQRHASSHHHSSSSHHSHHHSHHSSYRDRSDRDRSDRDRSDRDRYRDDRERGERDRERERDAAWDRHDEAEPGSAGWHREHERAGHSSSVAGAAGSSSGTTGRKRDRERERGDKVRDRERERAKAYAREKEAEWEGRERERDRDRERERDREGHSHRDREHRDRERERDRRDYRR